MANHKTKTEESSTVEKFQAAQAAILAKSDELKQLQRELEELKADYRSLVDELPYEVKQLFLFASPNGSESHGSPKAAAGKRVRSSKEDLERVKESILDQLQGKGKMGRKDFDMLNVSPQTFMAQVSALVEAGAVKKEGEKAATRYWVTTKK